MVEDSHLFSIPCLLAADPIPPSISNHPSIPSPTPLTPISPSIGRITTGLLLSIAQSVDIVEPISKFTAGLASTPGIGQIFNVSLEAWTPSAAAEAKYDLVWTQWCLGHLTDAQFVLYLGKCGKALAEGGWVVVKEDMCTGEGDAFDPLDSAVTR